MSVGSRRRDHRSSLKIRPPLVFSMSDVDWLVTELSDVLAQAA